MITRAARVRPLLGIGFLVAAALAVSPGISTGPAAAAPAPELADGQAGQRVPAELAGLHGQSVPHQVFPQAGAMAGPISDGIGAGLREEEVALPERTPLPASQILPGHREVDCAKLKCVALTFDDGPSAQTRELVKILGAKKVPATFFFVGTQVEQRPGDARAVVAAGNEVGDHSWSHPDLTTLKPEQIKSQLDSTAKAISQATGVFPTVIRPPYGAHNAEVDKLAPYPIILWNVDPADWRDRNPKIVLKRTTTGIKPGSIILMHETQPTTVEAVPKIIDKLRKQGLTPVTVSQLFGNGSMLEAGKAYYDRMP